MRLETVQISQINLPNAPKSKIRQQSLLQSGQVEPIRLSPDGDKYNVIDGRRRLIDLIETGATEVLALVEEVAELDAHWLALTLNGGTPNEMDEADHILYLAGEGYTQKQIAERIGYSQGTVSQRLRLAERLTDEVKAKVRNGEVKPTTAQVLTKLPRDKQQEWLNGDKTPKSAVETLRSWQSQNIEIEGMELPEVKPGLFLTAETMQQLKDGQDVSIVWDEVGMTLRRNDI